MASGEAEVFSRDAVNVDKANQELERAIHLDQASGDTMGDDEACHVPMEEIPEAMSPARDAAAIKMLLRSHNLDVLREERRIYWRSIYLRLEAASSACVVSSNAKTSISDAEALVDANSQLYRETILTCFGTSDMPNEEPELPHAVLDSSAAGGQPTFYLSDRGRATVSRILTCFCYNAPALQFCPMIHPVTVVIRHFLSEDDTYGFLTSLYNCKQQKYFFDSELQYEVAWRVARQLTSQYAKKGMSFLEAECSDDDINVLFQGWIWWIFRYLPFHHLVRIMDSYLFEGYKVLFRICFTLIHVFAKKSRAKESQWHLLLKRAGIQSAFKQFCSNLPISPNALLERSFKFRRFSKVLIQKASIRVEVNLKAEGLKALSSQSSKPLKRSRSQSEQNLPTHEDAQRIHGTSQTLTYKEPHRKPQLGVYPIQSLKSDLVSKNDLIAIWSWLPERMTMVSPELAYSSNLHGLSLSTFYARCEIYQQTLLIIKTINKEIFGAFCSACWAERNAMDESGFRQGYFGTGETFLFSFSVSAAPVHFPWVLQGKPCQNGASNSAQNRGKELFMCGQRDMVVIGGGEGTGLYLDASLTRGKTERCATFNNAPLCPSEDFEIAIIEVFGFFKND